MKEIERATATFDVATAAAILGHLYAAEYWIEGMAEWHVLWAGTPPPPLPSVCYTDRPARVGEISAMSTCPFIGTSESFIHVTARCRASPTLAGLSV